MLDLARQYHSIEKEIGKSVQAVCASQRYVLGPEVQAFENEAADFLGAKHAVGCASGTDAIWLALVAAGVSPGDEVITSPFSFFATVSAIIRAGARPVFADVDPGTLNLDPDAVNARIRRTNSARIRGLMPVHLYGQCADMTRFAHLVDEHKLAMVEDAAQAFGATWRGKFAGTMSIAGAFSFYPTKNLSCYGDGGLVTTNDDAVADHMRRMRNHGSRQRYYHEEIGWNSRLDSLQAAILRVKLKHIDDWNAERHERAVAYDVLFKSAGLLSTRSAKDGARPVVRPLARNKDAHHIFHQYVVRVERRDALRSFLTERKIGTEIYYPVPLHLQQCLGYLGYGAGDLPESELAAQEVLALPMYPEITPEEQASVVAAIAEFYA
ncbi:MAG: DegT/DnrJ/EryC1/StrS family aminotransferase [Acidobacteriales bacterium]|nr:DegT/DnrJ/EryC1/StrS family aminotransferase [Terriglobales bacterium]